MKGHHRRRLPVHRQLRGRTMGYRGDVSHHLRRRVVAGRRRTQLSFNSSRWYFWKFVWQTGSARLEVRVDSENGSVIYNSPISTGSHPYRPDPHYMYLGAPMGRAGGNDATLPGGTYKNVWASSVRDQRSRTNSPALPDQRRRQGHTDPLSSAFTLAPLIPWQVTMVILAEWLNTFRLLYLTKTAARPIPATSHQRS